MDDVADVADFLGQSLAESSPATTVARVDDGCIVPVILCGGAGTRLWPISREGLPKQFWPLLSHRSLLQDTVLRATGELADGCRFGDPLIVCNREHRFLIAAQLRDAGVLNPNIVLEPLGRNSAPAVAAAALVAAEHNPDDVLWIMPADAMITDTDALHQALVTATHAARAGRIVTFGMRPTAPETGFGYIELGDPMALPAAGVFEVLRFIEKPDASSAEVFATSGRHLWNSGMFIATARTLLKELERHVPDILAHMSEALSRGQRDSDFIRLEEAAFVACPSISLDYALAERTRNVAVVPTTFAWSDVGNWAAVWEASPKDEYSNVLSGDVMLEDVEGCLIRTDGTLTAVVGLRDVVVVVTADAVLALHRDRAQDVKQIVERLRTKGRSEAVAHKRVYRPWGYYESLTLSSRYQVKRIMVDVGQQLSLQKHFHRAEHWVVVSGSALVTRDHEHILVGENEGVYLPLGCVHRLQNVGRIPLALIEVQVGSYLGEDDIVRFEDEYGRN